VTGFPTAFPHRNSKRSSLPILTQAGSGPAELTLESRRLRPDRIRAIWPAEQGLASPAERLTIRPPPMTSELDIRPAADFALDASDTILPM
jgi:hypothetical protein